MAVPSSGQLSLTSIFAEVNESDYYVNADGEIPSLTNISTGGSPPGNAINTANLSANRPDGSTPHAMSEFYSYDHDFSPFSSVIADFTITAGISATVYSSALSFTLAMTAGTLTAAITDVAGADYGELDVSISGDGDPGTSGTDNSATGFKGIGETASLLNPTGGAASGTIHVRFKFKGNGTAATDVNNCTFTANPTSAGSSTDVVAITKLTTR
jgi:hypothetical protein